MPVQPVRRTGDEIVRREPLPPPLMPSNKSTSSTTVINEIRNQANTWTEQQTFTSVSVALVTDDTFAVSLIDATP